MITFGEAAMTLTPVLSVRRIPGMREPGELPPMGHTELTPLKLNQLIVGMTTFVDKPLLGTEDSRRQKQRQDYPETEDHLFNKVIQ